MAGLGLKVNTKTATKGVPMSVEEVLRPELIVLREIGTYGEKGIHIAALQKKLSGVMSRSAIIIALSRLEELGMIRAEWVKRKGRGGWKRDYFVSGEGTEFFLKKLDAIFK